MFEDEGLAAKAWGRNAAMPYVDSTMISWLDYDAGKRTLSVRFHSAPVLYTYADVPPEVYAALLAAPSKISFLKDEIDPVFRFADQPHARAGETGGAGTATDD
jgi:hypothetical protein